MTLTRNARLNAKSGLLMRMDLLQQLYSAQAQAMQDLAIGTGCTSMVRVVKAIEKALADAERKVKALEIRE